MLGGVNELEYWIWEHAMKFGYIKVLKCLKSKFIELNIPDCWVTALFYQEIKEKLEKEVMLESKNLKLNDFNCIHNTLLTLLKQHGKELSHIVKTTDLLALQLHSKAIFILMKSSNREPIIRRQAIECLFPMWNQEVWVKTKKSHNLKDGSREDCRRVYEEIRLNLFKDNPQQVVLIRFIGLMQKHFPTLIEFLRKIKRSTLEKIQFKSINLHPSLNFVHSLLEKGIENENSILRVLEEYQRQRLSQIGKKILNQRIKLCGKSVGKTWSTKVYALPPLALPESNEELYPACFESNPSMPTSYLARKTNGRSVKEVFVNKATPQDINGKFFKPHWFSEGSAIDVKQEDIETIQESSTDLSQVTNLPESVKNGSSAVTSNGELQPRISVESIKQTLENGENGSRNINLDQPLNGESNRVQQWINTHPPPSSSDSEKELFVFDAKKEKFCTVDQATLIRGNRKSHVNTSKLNQANQIRGGEENQTSSGQQPQELSQNKATPSKPSSSRPASVSSKRKERASIDLSDTEASIVYESAAVLTRAQKRALQSASPRSSFRNGSENSFSPHRLTRKRALLESQPSHSNGKGGKESTSTRKSSDQKKSNSKSTAVSTHSSTSDSDSDINPPSSKKKKNRILSSDSEDRVMIQIVSTPAPSESPSSYATPEQGTINPSGSVQMSKIYTQEKNSTKRRLYEDEDEAVSKIAKQHSVFDGQRKLNDLVVVLHKHSDQLKRSEEAVQHSEKLNSCLERVSNIKKA